MAHPLAASIEEIRNAVLAHEFVRFAQAERPLQDAVLESLHRSGELMPLFAEASAMVPFDGGYNLMAAYGGYLSLQYALKRQEWAMFRPLARRVLCDLAIVQAQQKTNEEPDLATLLTEYPLSLASRKPTMTDYCRAVTREAIVNGGPIVWQKVLSFSFLAHELSVRGESAINVERPLARGLEYMLGSRRLLKIVQIWDEIWTRVPLIDSDMYYHDSRLRRALLDKNIDHAFRLIAASIKSGLSSKDVIGHFVKAMYDIDFANPAQMVLLPIGLQALAAEDYDPRSREFQYAMARLAYDVMHFERSPKERIEYDQISLLKSREILIDFRKGFLKGVFLQAWGIAEYAFVHGFEPAEILDEVYRVSAAIGKEPADNMLALYHLWATADLIKQLGEDYSLYVLAYSIRYLVRQPKNKNLLDPFPDEQQ